MMSKRKIKYKGANLFVYPIGWLAFLMGRSTSSVRRWERAGILPRPIFETPDKIRWYCAPEIAGYVKIFKACNIRRRIPIESTPFKHNAHEYKLRLKQKLEEYVANNSQLKNHDQLEKVIDKHTHTKWQTEALRLLK